MTQCSFQHELDVAVRLARQAGNVILEYYRTDLAVDHKPGDEPVTAADRAADDLIAAGLRHAFPHDGLLTEESDDDLSRLDKSRVWIVDPLDGTADFIAATGEFVVQIALAVGGHPVLGVILQPTTGLLYCAVQGCGAYRVCDEAKQRLCVSTTRALDEMRLVASRLHYSTFVEAARQSLGIESVTKRGSVGLKAGLVAQGVCDLYVATTVAKEWDVCAPHALILEAGGTMTDLCGQPLLYNKPEVTACVGLIASNGLAHEQIVQQLAPLRRQYQGEVG